MSDEILTPFEKAQFLTMEFNQSLAAWKKAYQKEQEIRNAYDPTNEESTKALAAMHQKTVTMFFDRFYKSIVRFYDILGGIQFESLKISVDFSYPDEPENEDDTKRIQNAKRQLGIFPEAFEFSENESGTKVAVILNRKLLLIGRDSKIDAKTMIDQPGTDSNRNTTSVPQVTHTPFEPMDFENLRSYHFLLEPPGSAIRRTGSDTPTQKVLQLNLKWIKNIQVTTIPPKANRNY